MPCSSGPNAFSDAEAQAAALSEWRQKTAQRKAGVNSLRRKVDQLKKDAETVRKTALWVQERDELNREQLLCETHLHSIHTELRDVVRDDEHVERQVELAALKSLLVQQLEDIDAFSSSSPLTPASQRPSVHNDSATTATTSTTVTRRQRAVELRTWIEAEAAATQATLTNLSTSAAPEDLLNGTGGCDTVARTAQQSFMRLCGLYSPPTALGSIFAEALAAAEADARARIEAARCPTAESATDTQVLSTVSLIIKMGQDARQFDLTATTSAALRERVAAVFRHLTPAQVSTAVREASALRRAQHLSRAAIADYERTVTGLLASCEDAFVVAQQTETEAVEKGNATRLREAAQAHRQAKLAEKRRVHAALLQRRETVQEEQRSAALERAQVIQARRAGEFQERLRLLKVYEEQQAALKQKEGELAELKARQAEEAKVTRMRRNEARVEFRRTQEEHHRQESKRREDVVRELRRQKQQALERFFEAVDRQIGVEADPQRLLKATSSSAQTESYATLAQTTKPSLTGFSDDQIMKDPRVRLYHALLAAGLHTTVYGREVATRGYRVAPSQMSSENNPLRGTFS